MRFSLPTPARPALRPSRPRRISRGFTLIEMLVVISIIAILSSLMLPSLQKALGTARQMGCANNYKQIHFAVTNYLNDNNGLFPLCLWYTGDKGIGYVLTQLNYVSTGQQNLFLCPAMSDLTSYDNNTDYFLSYGPNNFVFPGYSATGAFVDRSSKTGDSAWRRIGGIRHPSQTMAIKDQYVNWRGYPQVRRWLSILEVHHWSAFDDSAVHGNSTNLLYLDGHAGTVFSTVMTVAEKQNLNMWGILTW